MKRLSVEERNQLATVLTERVKELYLSQNKLLLEEIEAFRQSIISDTTYGQTLVDLLHEANLLEEEIYQLSFKFRALKSKAKESLKNTDILDYIFETNPSLDIPIVDKYKLQDLIDDVCSTKVIEKYGKIEFNKLKIKKEISNLIYKLEKDYSQSHYINKIMSLYEDQKIICNPKEPNMIYNKELNRFRNFKINTDEHKHSDKNKSTELKR